MYKGKRFLAIIPARGGSKGIPKKNIQKVNGRPLIDYTISEALKSEYLDYTMVSTDSQEIADISKQCGAEIPFLREDYLASDEAKTIDVVVDAVQKITKLEGSFDYVVLLQPTQPLRKVSHIDGGITQLIDTNLDSLISVNEVDDHPLLMRVINENNELENLLNENSTVRRQDFQKYYKVNGALYINKLNESFNLSTSLNDNNHPFIMEKKYDLDIDDPYDLDLFRWVLNKKMED